MSKISLIIKREYITRVRNKTFLLSTFLLPIVMILFIFGTAFFAASSKDKLKKIAVVNDPGYFKANLKTDSTRLSFDFAAGIDSVNYQSKGYDAVLNLQQDAAGRKFIIHSSKQIGIDTKRNIEERLDQAYENYQLQQKGIRKEILDSINRLSSGAYKIENRVTDEQGKSAEVNAAVNYGVGFGSGILIYITMFIFGAMVMRGVMEEKTNRIAEVMISSVKPFELMMGKILGIAAVGLTQLVLWAVLITVLSSAAAAFFSGEALQQASEAGKSMPMSGNNAAMAGKFAEMSKAFGSVNWLLVLSCFAFYFLGGYLFYASLFAAIGSVINEDPQEAQSLMLPITMPIIFAFIILSSNLNTPDSPVMVWASMIPFTSPIVMMGRIPSGVPWYQLLASMALLVAGFIFTTWLAGKIYRTGILMYGKKASWKEMFKWAFRKS
ncbi:MAG: ABC transporter permease [Chitinophagaceae bacterium]|nr:ABC transporter permease [Chitinophagaceae bacterium]